jgi:hypothetical protein
VSAIFRKEKTVRNNQTLTAAIALAQLLIAFSLSAPAAERLLVFGDSWGGGSFFGLEKSFASNAPGKTVVPAAVPGETASLMNSLDLAHGLPNIASTIAAHPTVDMMQLSIGGNDLLLNWTGTMTPAVEDALLTSIVDDIEGIVMHALAQRPDLELFYSSYDYFRRLPRRESPLQMNTVFQELHSRVESRLADMPRVTTHNFYGLMQNLYGYSPLGLPPGDPALPDINLPGPPEPFYDAIHLSWDLGDGSSGPFGFDQFAAAQYDVFYRSRLVPEPRSWSLLTLAAFGLLSRRRAFGKPGLR